MPRKKTEEFYKLHGFTANCERGKYTATCNFCDRVLQNTALTRLALHRQNCNEPPFLVKTRKDTQAEYLDEYIESQHQIKIQNMSDEEDDGLASDNEGKEIIVKIQQILDAADDGKAKQALVKGETYESADAEQEAVQQMEFEISSADFIDENKEMEDSNNGSTMFLEPRPKNNLASLKAEKMRAEIRHYQSKTKFLKTETDNLKLERTLALLRIQKLRLEIDGLRS
ncbi:uncharacterized protein LOC110186547 [Drosophila serrata]|uniref:uncharacterized protein LOC110186547 n=1 Tax=Drosophila serrata TaxID=7274 RepID=UPI000A1D3425|nr:uncharacterized protein LOC110186547 [Drosophila serrata]